MLGREPCTTVLAIKQPLFLLMKVRSMNTSWICYLSMEEML
jgi:hypothetical protein